MNLLITGGSGFIAGRLLKHLYSKVENVLLVTRNRNLSFNISENIKTTIIDWDNQSHLENLCKNIDIVIHTAGMNSKDCFENPDLAIKFNGYKTLELINASIKNNIKKFIFLSTAHVYSHFLKGTINEDTKTLNSHPYAKSNRIAEDFLIESISNSQLKGMIIRLSNIFGKPLSIESDCWHLVVQDICLQAIKNKKIFLKTNGFQKRDFIPMSSLCFLVEKIIKDNLEVENNILNFGSGKSQTILEMATFIQERTMKNFGFSPEIIVNDKDNNIDKYCLNYNSKFKFVSSLEIETNKYKEVDDILHFCKYNFNNSKLI